MSSGRNIPVHANRLDSAVDQFCFSAWSCDLSSAIAELWTLIAVGLAVGLVLATLAYLRIAEAELAEEQSRTAAELDAYSTFAERVSEIPTNVAVEAGWSAQGGVSTLSASSPTGSTVRDVRTIYRETVMAVPHYEEEYSESLEENMAKEFGTDVTEAVVNGSELSPVLQKALVAKATHAANQRQSFMGSLGHEEESLGVAIDPLEEVQTELSKFHPDYLREDCYPTLVDRWEELDGLYSKCQSVIEDRQDDLRAYSVDKSSDPDSPTLTEYLYQSLDVNYPVLATGATILDQIRTSKETVSRIAASRS